jgi:DNA-binding response OmpR family regulator
MQTGPEDRDDDFVMRSARAGSNLVALARNRNAPARRVARLHVADLEIDALDRRISQGSRELRLSPSEHVLLYTLASARGTVVPYDSLADALGIGPEIRANTVARHVTTLRRKLGDAADRPRYIETVSGTGYRFIRARSS